MKGKQLEKIVSKLTMISFKDGQLIESKVLKYIKLLRLQPRFKAIFYLSQYLKELKRKQREHTLYIESVIPLSPIQVNKIKKFVDKKDLQVQITKVVTGINPEILGGFRLRFGDEIWDETVLGKINQVREAIVSE